MRLTPSGTPQPDNNSGDIENSSQPEDNALATDSDVADGSGLADDLPVTVPAEPDAADNGTGQAIDTGSSDSCLLYTSPSPRDQRGSRMPSSA